MDFESLAAKFRKQAESEEKSEEYISACLAYAEKLCANGCPVIFTPKHLASLVGYKYQYLYKAYYGIELHYKVYDIPKKDGGRRRISEPLPSLKEIQRWILDNVLYAHPAHPYAKAYVPGKKIRENMRFHRKQDVVLALDIHDFFGSITIENVFEIFRGWGYSKDLSLMFSRLLCLDGSLPQGAPTSPHLSNLYMKEFDEEIARYCKRYGGNVRYTRYADDMTFSGNFNPQDIIETVKRALPRNLKLNDRKTRVMRKSQRQMVTGCVVNEKLQLPKKERKELRQRVYFIWKYGLKNHMAHIGEDRKHYLKHLLGRVCYASYICPSDKHLLRYGQFLFELYKKEVGSEYDSSIIENIGTF